MEETCGGHFTALEGDRGPACGALRHREAVESGRGPAHLPSLCWTFLPAPSMPPGPAMPGVTSSWQRAVSMSGQLPASPAQCRPDGGTGGTKPPAGPSEEHLVDSSHRCWQAGTVPCVLAEGVCSAGLRRARPCGQNTGGEPLGSRPHPEGLPAAWADAGSLSSACAQASEGPLETTHFPLLRCGCSSLHN